MSYPRIETSSQIPSYAAIYDSFRGHINSSKLFTAYYNAVPHVIVLDNINCEKAMDWFYHKYREEISDSTLNKRYSGKTGKKDTEQALYNLNEDLLVDFFPDYSEVKLLFRNSDERIVHQLTQEISRFKKYRSRTPEIYLLREETHGLGLAKMKIIKPKLSIEDNYNEDFLGLHQHIIKRLSKKNDKGLLLLHGKPGTGKTSYIRYLISSVKKKIIFLPPNLALQLTSPHLLSILMENPNAVFVIEDAENIVMNRDQSDTPAVSTLLNLTDGLLSDCLNIQIICSFNTDLSKIDSALLRKGRLIAKYEFTELQIEKAQKLSEKLGFSSVMTSPMSLTEIYNQVEQDFAVVEKRNRIGF